MSQEGDLPTRTEEEVRERQEHFEELLNLANMSSGRDTKLEDSGGMM